MKKSIDSVIPVALGFLFFPNFQLPGKQEISKKIPGISKIPKIREIPGKLSPLNFFSFFLIFSISDPIFNILLCCFDKLSLSFFVFSTN